MMKLGKADINTYKYTPMTSDNTALPKSSGKLDYQTFTLHDFSEV